MPRLPGAVPLTTEAKLVKASAQSPQLDRTPKLGRPVTRAGRGRAASQAAPRAPAPATATPSPALTSGGGGRRGARARRSTVSLTAVLVRPPLRAVSSGPLYPPSSVLTLTPAPVATDSVASPGSSEASRASQSSPTSMLPAGAAGDIGYTLADLDSIYRDQDSMTAADTDARDSFGVENPARPSSPDDESEDVEVEEMSPENFAQVNLSQDSLDVILPAQMLNGNIFDIPDFPENFLENLDDEALNDADEPEPPSPGDLVIDCPNHNSATEDQPEIEEEQDEPEQNRPEQNDAPEVVLHNRPPQYMLELPADNILGPNIFDDDSDDIDEPNIYDEEYRGHNVIELNILEPNLFEDDDLVQDIMQPHIYDEDRPAQNLLEQNILEPNLIVGERLDQNGPVPNGHGPIDNDQENRD